MEEALRASERKYRQLVEHAVDGIILGDASGHLIDVNPKACEMTGYALKDLLGRHISELYSKSVLQQSPLRYTCSFTCPRTLSSPPPPVILTFMRSSSPFGKYASTHF